MFEFTINPWIIFITFCTVIVSLVLGYSTWSESLLRKHASDTSQAVDLNSKQLSVNSISKTILSNKSKGSRILLLTAHPDDEAMFFSPTILALLSTQLKLEKHNTSKFEIFLLCLSKGINCGDTRKEELYKAGPVLGIPHNNIVVGELQDAGDVRHAFFH